MKERDFRRRLVTKRKLSSDPFVVTEMLDVVVDLDVDAVVAP